MGWFGSERSVGYCYYWIIGLILRGWWVLGVKKGYDLGLSLIMGLGSLWGFACWWGGSGCTVCFVFVGLVFNGVCLVFGLVGWDCEWVVLFGGGWFVLIGLNFLVWGLYCRLGGFL